MTPDTSPRDDDALQTTDGPGDPGPHPREQCKAMENDDGDIVIYELGDGNRWIASSISARTTYRR